MGSSGLGNERETINHIAIAEQNDDGHTSPPERFCQQKTANGRKRRNMGKKRSPLALLLLLGLGLLGGGCNRHDTERLSSIGRKIMDRASTATAGFREKLDGLKGSRGGDSIQDKVTLRLRWEKVLADTPIEVVVSGQEIELKGTVKTAEQRTRAVELAEATVGVERVLVSLSVAEVPAPTEKKDE
jgi:hypothetical protein